MLVEYRQDPSEAGCEARLLDGPTAWPDLTFLDPNTWRRDDDWEWRIYGDDNAQTWAIVDEVDYHWAIRWRWNINVKMSRRNPLKTKLYMRRAVGENANGVRLRTHTVYLHTEIMKRTGILPLTDKHVIVDHRNGKSLDCRRANMRWATHSMNSLNRFGQNPHDLVEG